MNDFLTPFPIYVRSLPHPFSNLCQVTSSPLFQFISGHFLTPFPIYVRSLPHPFSNLCQVTSSPLFQFMSGHSLTPFPIFQCVSFEYLSKQPKFWASRIQFTRSDLNIYIFNVYVIHFFTLFYWRNKLQYCPWIDSAFFESQPNKLTLTECNKNVCLFFLTGYWSTHLPWVYTSVTKFYNMHS